MAEPAYIVLGATFDAHRFYRYRLWRVWDSRLPRVAFVMLNPSTADEEKLDPTLRRCLGYALAWGCGSFEVGNLYGLRSTDPKALERFGGDIVGPENDRHLVEIAQAATFGVVAGWGANARRTRADAVTDLLRRHRDVYRLGKLTGDGYPRHPLYLPKDEALVLHATRRAA